MRRPAPATASLPWLILVLTAAPAGALAAPMTGGDSGDIGRDLNKLRAQGCGGRPWGLAPLHPSAALDRVARRLASGLDLAGSQRASAYHSVVAASIALRGVAPGTAAMNLLEHSFCRQTLDPGFTEYGQYRRGDRVWIALARPLSLPDPRRIARMQVEVLELTNRARAAAHNCGGVAYAAAPALRSNPLLALAAQRQAQDMARHGFMDHRGSDGSQPADRVTAAGYQWRRIGENLAQGVPSAREVVDGWLHSPHHCANLMTPEFRELGVAVAINPDLDGGIWWVQEFGVAR